MYGMIGKMIAAGGKREELMDILIEGSQDMPGCLSYVVAADQQDDTGIWITEVWESQDHHQASLSLDSVQQAIARGRPLIAGFDQRVETLPRGGSGINLNAG